MNLLKPFLILLLLVFGAAVMSLEILASNLMAPYFGSSVYVWGSIISSFMVHLALGYVLGGHLSARTGRLAPLLGFLALGSVWVLFVPGLVRSIGSVLETAVPDVRLGSLLAMNAVFLVPIAFMGMVSPYVIGLTGRSSPVRMTAGVVLFVSTMGSFLGTNLTSFYLIERAPVSTIVRGVGVLCLLCSVLSFAAGLDRRLARPRSQAR